MHPRNKSYLVMRNVGKLVQVQEPNYQVDRNLIATEVRKALQLVKDDRLHALYVLALYLGMRRAEQLELPWEPVDLDLDQGVWKFGRACNGSGESFS